MRLNVVHVHSVAAALACSLALACVGCSSQPLSPRLTDTAVGIAAGATMGAIVGAAAGGPLIGSIVGAGVGGVGGFLLGNQIAIEQNQQGHQSQSQDSLDQPQKLTEPAHGTVSPAQLQGASGS
jgi:phage tail tape-measure protein